MTLLEFLCQDKKKIQQDLKDVGITNYRELPRDLKAFVKLLNLDSSDNIGYCYLDSTYQQYKYEFHVNLPVKDVWKDMVYVKDYSNKTSYPGKHELEFYITFNGKCHVKDLGIYRGESIYLVNRPIKMYNDEDFETYSVNLKDKYNRIPEFNTLKEAFDYVLSKFSENEEYVFKAYNFCQDDTLINIYNKISQRDVKFGQVSIHEYMHGFIGFAQIVRLIKNFKEIYNYDISLEEMVAYSYYISLPAQKKIIANYREEKNKHPYGYDAVHPVEVPDTVKMLDMCIETSAPSIISEYITLDRWKEVFKSVDNEDVRERQEKWKKLFTDSNTEFTAEVNNLRKIISEKYGIPEKYLVYNLTTLFDYTVPEDVNI